MKKENEFLLEMLKLEEEKTASAVLYVTFLLGKVELNGSDKNMQQNELVKMVASVQKDASAYKTLKQQRTRNSRNLSL